ncbi:hypothetical protein GCM10011369_24490 [Neiella marina]|uniref:Glycosyltransferase family 8 protein n=1 Tax=Neiella marina TaxID=508461 RepID=A0A8J2U663_9GAMM|nr:glycosyltransferase [Neiella marina]GGA81621.1 hypothetical protein GCM10011369_24490 [Neiella marina]
MPKPHIAVACCADENYVIGLTMAMVSCFAQASGHYHYKLYVIDCGLAASSITALEQKLAHTALLNGASYELAVIKPPTDTIASLPEHLGSWITYARFLLADMIDESHVVYLDSDILCLRGVEDFIVHQTGAEAIVGVRDPIGTIKHDCPCPEQLQLPDDPYLNAGLLLLNLDWMRCNLPLTKVLQWVSDIGLEHLTHADQTIINMVCQGHKTVIEKSNNWVLETVNASQLAGALPKVNIHYINRPKPWQPHQSEPRKYLANKLFIEAANHYQIAELAAIEINPKAWRKAKRKALFYRLFNPKRAIVYQAIVAAVDYASTAERLLSKQDLYSNMQQP